MLHLSTDKGKIGLRDALSHCNLVHIGTYINAHYVMRSAVPICDLLGRKMGNVIGSKLRQQKTN